MAALWQRSLRGERGRGRDSVHSAIPYGPYQLTSARAITPARCRNTLCPPVDTAIRYRSIRMLGCITLARRTAVDESALDNRHQPSQTCGRDPRAVDIDGRGSSGFEWPHRRVALPKPRSVSRKPDLPLTMVATSSCGPDARRATWQCGHRISPRLASKGPAARMDRAGRRFGRAGGAGAIRWSPSALACGGANRTIHARRGPTSPRWDRRRGGCSVTTPRGFAPWPALSCAARARGLAPSTAT